MSKFDELDYKKENNIEGSFDCHWCSEVIGQARYDREDQELVYECTQGHKSKIKGFRLD